MVFLSVCPHNKVGFDCLVCLNETVRLLNEENSKLNLKIFNLRKTLRDREKKLKNAISINRNPAGLG